MPGLTKKIDFRKVSTDIIDGRTKILRGEALNIVAGIHRRTLQGKDYKLKAFKPYDKDYKKYRSKHGRSSSVNLTYTGRMLKAMTTKRIKNGLRFTFMSSRELKKAGHNSVTRDFFGVSTPQIKYLQKVLGKLYSFIPIILKSSRAEF